LLNNCTFSHNSCEHLGGAIACGETSFIELQGTIVAFSGQGEGVFCGDCGIAVTCCDIFGNAGGDWIGCIADQYGVNGNFSADPLFCDPGDETIPMLYSGASPYTLHADSPCLPGNHPDGYDCGLIGAYGIGCGPSTSPPVAKSAAVEETTWGRIKVGYR
jgi:predicted outer membrane repeat protein